MTPLLRLSNISKSFGAVRALRGVSFELLPGEVHALVGENGAGKSTLIKVITGAYQPDGGILEIEGQQLPSLNPALARSLGISAVYQQRSLFPDLTVAENIAVRLDKPSPLRRVSRSRNRARAQEFLSRIGANIPVEREVRELSMPEQQLVEIACSLGAGARILIMDEPTASLTAREVDALLKLVEELRTQGVGTIYISHRLEEVFRVADRVTVLRDGESVGTRPLRSGSGGAEASAKSLTESELIRLMIGRELTSIFPPSESTAGNPVLALQNLGCAFSGVHGINLEVRSGEVVGLAGLVGAGRTELARILFGITPGDEGQILLEGKPVRITSPLDAIASGIGYVPEDRRRHGVILEMSIASNITLAIHERIFPGGWLRFGAERSLARDYISDLAIKTPSEETRAGNLSGGNQQKVAVARWLAAKPKLLILDEPTQGVDVGAKTEIHKLIRRLTRQGLAVLMISSELPEILGMCDRIAVMRGGRMVKVLESRKADAHSIMAAALGQSAA